MWQLDAVPDGIELLGSDCAQRNDAQIGVASTQLLHLRAGHAGNFVLTLVLRRRWKGAFIETHRVEVNAR
jgi:hypothetical protein